MTESGNLIEALLQKDKRYKRQAYAFVFEALNYAHEKLGMGGKPEPGEEDEPGAERHLTGQQLCEGARLYALDQYGYMAKCVLNSWGVHTTGDIGEIVFNLIDIGHMRKTESDRREDFEDVFDFESGLDRQFRITMPE